MRTNFEMQLETLNNELITLGALCESAISDAVKALLSSNMTVAEKSIETKAEIDRRERDIEGMCMRLLLRQQPVARDLRLISAALKSVTDMERIGDQASDIAELVAYANLSESRNDIHIAEMSKAVSAMVTGSIDAFVRRDASAAEAVIRMDDTVDTLFSETKHDLIELIAADPRTGETALDTLMIAKYLERIGDHAVNIAGWAVFAITGCRPDIN